jgi:adenylosuccinate lyase
VPQLAGAELPSAVRARAQQLASEPPSDAAAAVKEIEARINHDVKAVEYYVRQQLTAAGASEASLELVHFGCTSEDINNLSYARLLRAARIILSETLDARITEVTQFAQRYAETAMLARTHGQPASPTTLGKEFANFTARLRRVTADWPRISREFVESLELQSNAYTTQIEPHDWIGEYCDAVAAINVVLIDLSRDLWGYISLGYLRQRPVAGEVGSSTMPHKVNPIDFENAEGNLGIANALLRHFSEKLPVSRWQRDLTDSTVLRNLGVALGHTLIAWRALGRGLDKVAADPARIAADINGAWEVLGEAVQTVLRAVGSPSGYERLKDFTRGRAIDAHSLAAFIDTLPLPEAEKDRLKSLSPQAYIGLAASLARAL